jgi:intracellular sulfur oxidation DsrE/DsrF family protein
MEYFMFLLTGHSSFMNWNMVKAVARNGISSAFISEADKEAALKDFKQKVSRIETVLAETEIAGAEETVQKEPEQPSSEPVVKETSSGTTLSVPQIKNVLNPVGAIQKTEIEIIAGRQAVEKLKEGKTDVKEALVIINDIAKAEELRQEGLNVAAAVMVQKEEKSKLKGSKKIGTIGQYKGAAVRVYWNEKTKQLMFYSKEGLDGADVEVLKEMFANMQTEGIKADTLKE